MLADVSPSHYSQERKGFWYEPDGTPTSETVALATWAQAAREILTRTAGTYHAVIRDSELAEELQATTGIRTTRSLDRWLHKVLAPVAVLCDSVGEPPLTSLVVGAHDDLAAARNRLECYQWAGSAPADGGVPAQLPDSAPRRQSRAARPARSRSATSRPDVPAPKRRVAKTDRPVAVCPTCFMALPATGVCDNCD
jgi:hypothetical protein